MKSLKWYTSFPGVYHLIGGPEHYKIWIEDIRGSATVYKTRRNGFCSKIYKEHGALEYCKKVGEKWGDPYK